MLDTQTKRRIDDCRDILVGKLPDPKAQIEQITIGLIYKFMDDMDKEAIELGGSTKFFSDDYEKYAWDKLFDTKVTATEMLRLYSEAIESMEKNPNIPQLFRDIFKNAYLPYRDPETLKLFLKTIGEFQYTHSEKLGDAFEYLLSIMGSQGDAGQFRTPRHIIDFLVSIVDPDIGETILDPACGTAGFLISAYKHILLKHTKANKEGLNIYEYNNLENKSFNNLGDQLTPDNRKKLIQNIAGYDISPDMVRLSLVNLYLHGFPDPEINEYDTLSSEERWNENFDVVLANPPFMSPKGGIRPHKKFTIISNRSEVLFVDYIAEHLNPKGKAGIIVPEGVIFQNGRAYKDLRKMLIENYLYAVVSLPAGVFNPYSGVKTSILLMDRTIARQRNDILFVKIDNDGYGLGAQRAAVKGSQLEEAIAQVSSFRKGDQGSHAELVSASHNQTLKQVQDGHPELVSGYGTIAHAVPKSEIAANGDYNLSGERYKVQVATNSRFELVDVNELFESIRNGRNVKQFDQKGKYRVTRIQTISDATVNLEKTKWTNDVVPEDYFMQEGDILLSHINSIEHLAKSAIYKGITEPVVHGANLIRFKPDKTKVIPEFISAIFKSQIFIDTAKSFAQKAVNQASLRVADLKSIQIPLPPLSIQEEIVAEIGSYQKIIDSAKAIVDNYKPRIDIDPDWEMVELGEVFNKINTNLLPIEMDVNEVNYIGLNNISQGTGQLIGDFKTNPKNIKSTKTVFKPDQILYGKLRPNLNKVYYSEITGICSTDIFVLEAKDGINPKFYSYHFLSHEFNYEVLKGIKGAQLPRVGYDYFSTLIIPKPPLETKRQIVAQIEKELELVNANKQLIEIFEQKIKDRIAKVWGEDKEQEESLRIAAELGEEYVNTQ